MPEPYPLQDLARLPEPGDNVAIATRRLEAGTMVALDGSAFSLSHTVMEGHRFAVAPVEEGAPLLSWDLPFGLALRDITPGEYVCNSGMLDQLRLRNLDFALPSDPNFQDQISVYSVDEGTFRPGRQVQRVTTPGTFRGHQRSGDRGAGTRNYILILGTSSRTASYARQLERRMKDRVAPLPNVDGVVAIAHTEGGGTTPPNNLDLLLRTLAGFVVHPNVGAVLAVDHGTEVLTNATLREYMLSEGYPLAEVPHRFLSLEDGFAEGLEQGERIIQEWLDTVDAVPRADVPLEGLKIAMQCGGSDAFSGVSGNPLAAWVAREVIRNGGSANLAETDELIGAEPYVLENVRDLATARRFLETVERYKQVAAWHGASAEGNPTGGNKFRGLYNIALKSIGAARKRHPEVRLDEVISYGERMSSPGYYFMDSPGNDLESIAGQVASGCNMIFFVTGNGSITNFPLAPTIKIVTTTPRFELLSKEMDVNAGALLEGTPLEVLGREIFELSVAVASGKHSKGEEAGHAQVSLWRNWRQTGPTPDTNDVAAPSEPSGKPIPVPAAPMGAPSHFQAIRTERGIATDRVGLVLPASLCSGQIANMAADRLTQKGIGRDRGMSRFVALPHTEGCCVGGEPARDLYHRTMLGHLTHPSVGHALFLEHGCETTHNDYFRHQLEIAGMDPDAYGWASVQADGGIEQVLDRIETWFADRISQDDIPVMEAAEVGALRVGLVSSGSLSNDSAESLSLLTRHLVGMKSTVLVPENAGLFSSPVYRLRTLGDMSVAASLAYGQRPGSPGFHIMQSPTDHWVETLVGLVSAGVDILLAFAGDHPLQGHPLVPVIQVACEANPDVDLVASGNAERDAESMLALLLRTASREYQAQANRQGNVDFQITRGLMGVSL